MVENPYLYMDTTYYVIYGMLLLLSVFGLVVGVSNDACNFLNSSIGSRAGTYNGAVAVAAVGVLLGASFSSGMMEIARSGVFIPSMFSFHEVMLLFLAVMVANVILLDVFNTLGLPTSTTMALIFALLGSSLGMAYFNLGDGPGSLADYINTDKVLFMVAGIFCSVAVAFTVGTFVMWLARLLYTFHYQRMYRLVGPVWCGFAFTAITYFAVFKGLKTSPVMKGPFMDMVDANIGLAILITFAAWTIIAALLQYGCKVNTLRLTVLAGTGALALAFAGNDLVNFIGVFMASQTSMELAEAHLATGGDLASLKMGGLADVQQQVNMLWLVAAGLVMVTTLFFSKKARKVTETELKLSSASTGKERFGSCSAARTMVRYTLNTKRFFERVTPMRIQNFISKRFAPLAPEEETGAIYDLVRGSVNLTVSALLISIATEMKLPLSTTYVTFMVAMGSSLADRAWGRDSAVYRITGVLTVIGGWLLTALAASLAAFIVAIVMAYGGFWGMVTMLVIAGALLIKSTFFTNSTKEEIRLINMHSDAAVKDFGKAASGRLGRMVGIYNAMVKALISEDRDTLKRLRKKSRTLKRDLEVLRENEVLPTLRTLPKELADRGQLVFRITEISLNTCERLLTLVKASYNHIDNNHQGLTKEQGDDLLALTNKIGRFYPNLTDMLKTGNFEGINALLEDREQLSEDFADCITRHLMHNTADESGMRNGILYLTLLNETRAMISHAFALIERVKEIYED